MKRKSLATRSDLLMLSCLLLAIAGSANPALASEPPLQPEKPEETGAERALEEVSKPFGEDEPPHEGRAPRVAQQQHPVVVVVPLPSLPLVQLPR